MKTRNHSPLFSDLPTLVSIILIISILWAMELYYGDIIEEYTSLIQQITQIGSWSDHSIKSAIDVTKKIYIFGWISLSLFTGLGFHFFKDNFNWYWNISSMALFWYLNGVVKLLLRKSPNYLVDQKVFAYDCKCYYVYPNSDMMKTIWFGMIILSTLNDFSREVKASTGVNKSAKE